jgi:hypothetical protein
MLDGVGLLDLFPQLYTTIWIPEHVAAEYAAQAHRADDDQPPFPGYASNPPRLTHRFMRLLALGRARLP